MLRCVSRGTGDDDCIRMIVVYAVLLMIGVFGASSISLVAAEASVAPFIEDTWSEPVTRGKGQGSRGSENLISGKMAETSSNYLDEPPSWLLNGYAEQNGDLPADDDVVTVEELEEHDEVGRDEEGTGAPGWGLLAPGANQMMLGRDSYDGQRGAKPIFQFTYHKVEAPCTFCRVN